MRNEYTKPACGSPVVSGDLLAAEIAKAIVAEFYLTRSIFEPYHLDDDAAEGALREIIMRTANKEGQHRE